METGASTLAAGAGGFAGVMADPAADAGKGVLAAEQFEGLLVFALGHQGHAALETGVGRAGGLAGGRSLFLDGVGRWHGLGVALEGRFAGAQALVEVVGHVDGADLAAFAAGRARSISMKRGRWRRVAVKLPASPVTACTSVMVYRSMFRWRPASTSLGEMIHMEQSLVGKVLSNWDMTPPMAERCYARTTR
jgi:hypothetical protein